MTEDRKLLHAMNCSGTTGDEEGCTCGLRFKERIAQLEQELAEHEFSFDLRWKADMRAIKIWRGDDPDKELIWPDHADLCVWLLEERDRLQGSIEILCNTDLVKSLKASTDEHLNTNTARRDGKYRNARFLRADEHFVRFEPDGGGRVSIPYERVWLDYERDLWLTAEVERLRSAIQALRVNACQLTAFLYGAVQECGEDMIKTIDAALAGQGLTNHDLTGQRLDPDVADVTVTDTERLEFAMEQLFILADCGPETRRIYDTRGAIDEAIVAMKTDKGKP